MSVDRETIEIYNARAQDYAQLTEAEAPDRCLRAFLATLPPRARVLDLGCGPGRSARMMAEAGHQPLAVDASDGMIALAAQQPGVTARVASFDDIPDLGMFEGVWANFSLLHATQDSFPRHLADIKAALAPGGVFHIGLKLGDGISRDSIGRRYLYLTDQDLDTALREAGFDPFHEERGRGTGLSGEMADWITVLSRA